MELQSSPPIQGFRQRLKVHIATVGTSLCVGVDPHMAKMPSFFARFLEAAGAAAFLTRFSQCLIEASVGQVAAIKFQSAFFEAHGAPGLTALEAAIAQAKASGLITILDAKRGDIASTMTAYGQMAFAALGADALTVMPYMGMDTIEPLVPWLAAGRGIYVVWVSSNPSGGLIQDAAAEPLLEALVQYCSGASVMDGLGLVLGATKVEQLPNILLERIQGTCLLMPGLGAQGGTLTPRIQRLIRTGGAALLPQSRSISAFEGVSDSWSQYQDLVAQRVRSAARQLRL